MGSITGHMNKARLNRCIYWVLYCLKKAGRYTNEYKKQHTNRTGSRDFIDFCTGCQKYILCDVEGHNERDGSV